MFHARLVPTNLTVVKQRAIVVLRDSQLSSKDPQTSLNAKVNITFIFANFVFFFMILKCVNIL